MLWATVAMVTQAGVEELELGLYVIRGDNMCVCDRMLHSPAGLAHMDAVNLAEHARTHQCCRLVTCDDLQMLDLTVE